MKKGKKNLDKTEVEGFLVGYYSSCGTHFPHKKSVKRDWNLTVPFWTKWNSLFKKFQGKDPEKYIAVNGRKKYEKIVIQAWPLLSVVKH